MTNYLDRLDALPPSERWRMARGFLFGEPMPFFAELREKRPICNFPEVTLVTRYEDCNLVLLSWYPN